MRSRRVDYGSFRERMEDLVPLLGVEGSPHRQGPAATPKALVGPHGSLAYVINQYLFEHSRH